MAYFNERQKQAEITQNLMPDQTDARQRLNASQQGGSMQVYPLGEKANLNIPEGAPLYSWKRPPHAAPSQRGARMPPTFATLNGLQWGQYEGGEREMENRLIFVGISKSTKRLLDPTDPEIGVAAVTFGATSCDVRSNTQAIHPGDDVAFQMVPFHTHLGEYQQASHRSYAKTALVPILNPINWSRITYYLEDIYNIMFSTDSRTGVYNISNGALDLGGHLAGKGLNSDQRAAIALRKTTNMTVARGAEEYALRGMIKIMTPAEKEREAIMMRALIDNPELLAQYKAVPETDAIRQTNVVYRALGGDDARGQPAMAPATLTETHTHFKYGLHLQGEAQALGITVAELRKRHQHAVLWLAAVSGAIPSTLKAEQVENSILQAVFGRFSSQMHNARVFSTTVAELSTDYPNHPLIVDYVKNSEDFVSEFHQLVNEGYHNLRKTIIGMALSEVPAGQQNGKMDIVANLNTR